jgi:hypothetical protein
MWGKGSGRDGASASPETTTVTVTNSPSNVRAAALRLLLLLTLQRLLADSAALCAPGARQNKLRVHLHKPERPACGLGLCRAGELVRLDHRACTLHACHCARPSCKHSSGRVCARVLGPAVLPRKCVARSMACCWLTLQACAARQRLLSAPGSSDCAGLARAQRGAAQGAQLLPTGLARMRPCPLRQRHRVGLCSVVL